MTKNELLVGLYFILTFLGVVGLFIIMLSPRIPELVLWASLVAYGAMVLLFTLSIHKMIRKSNGKRN